MAEIPSQLSFSTLISHTFPGVFVAIGIFLMLYTQFSDSINNLFSSLEGENNNWTSFIGAVGILIFFGTMIGIIVDSLSHVIIGLLYYNFCPDNRSRAQTENELDLMKGIKKVLIKFLKGALNIIVFMVTLPFYWWAKNKCQEIERKEKCFFKDKESNKVSWFYYIGSLPIERLKYIDENYYCYQECMFNLSISFLFSSIAYTKYLIFLEYNPKLVYIILSFFIILFYICFNLGLYFFINLKLNRAEFIKGATGY